MSASVWVLLDGVGDLPHSLRENDSSKLYEKLPLCSCESKSMRKRLTPLQIARTPNCDAVATAGRNGLVDPVEPGLACGSDTAHLSLFGYEPRLWYKGRGICPLK